MRWRTAPPAPRAAHKPLGQRFNFLRSLQVPLLLVMSLAVILAGLGTSRIHGHVLRESLLSLAEERAHHGQVLIQNRLNQYLTELRSHARYLLGRYDLQTAIRANLTPARADSRQRLEELFEHSKQAVEPVNLFLVDANARVIFRKGEPSGLPLASLRDLIGKGEQADLLKTENTLLLYALQPIEINGDLRGALILTQEVEPLLNRLSAEYGVNPALADASGILARSRSRSPASEIRPALVARILAGTEMLSISDESRNLLSHYIKTRLGTHTLVQINDIDLAPTLRLLQQKQAQALRLCLLLLALILPGLFLGLHLLLRPLKSLRQRAGSLARHISGIEPIEPTGNEIGRLVKTFDIMATALEEYDAARRRAEAQLQQEHATLEIRIGERTRTLEESNQLLQREITERTRAQKKAEELQKLMGQLIDAIPSCLIGVDRQGCIRQWNRAAHQFFGLTVDQVRGQPLQRALPRLKQIDNQLRQTLDQGYPDKVPHLKWVTDDRIHVLEVMVYPLAAGAPEGAVIHIADITERVRLEELMLQTEKMVSVGGLAAGMAHEINNPLACIVQGVQVINQRLSTDLQKNCKAAEALGIDLDLLNAYLKERQIHKMLASILESGQRAGEIVSNMLNFTRRKDEIKSPHSLTELLDRAVELAGKDYDLKKRFDFHNIRIERVYEQGLPQVVCTSIQLQQVFFNLLQNSAQAMASWCDMRAQPQITLTVKRHRQMILVEICDNGPGIPPDLQKRIFEPFFTTKEVGQGTGLGLSVSYYIITENHGGRFEVDSAPGAGTCFRIFLPLFSAEELGKVPRG